MQIHHDEAAGRFECVVDGEECRLDYRREAGVMVITHTWVPSSVGGRGIAGKLVEAAFGVAAERGWQVDPRCSYAAAWAARHPEVAGLLRRDVSGS